jgi:hypothetical protein
MPASGVRHAVASIGRPAIKARSDARTIAMFGESPRALHGSRVPIK